MYIFFHFQEVEALPLIFQAKFVITRISFKGITRSPDEKHPQFSKIYNFDMITIHIGILIYPVKDSAERGIIFLKYILYICTPTCWNFSKNDQNSGVDPGFFKRGGAQIKN